MIRNMGNRGVIRKIASKRVLDQNSTALKTYTDYKKIADIIERAEFASGKRVVFKYGNSSTSGFRIDLNGTYSTTAQTI